MKQYILKQNPTEKTELDTDFDRELNPSQKEVVYFNDGPLLVIAGAGSGKTRTLTYRVARLINSGVTPQSILLLTFTRKAAQEMLRRATQILDNRCQNISGGTFHSFANTTLRRYAQHIGYDSSFTILDRTDSEDLINMIRKELNYNKTEKCFPKKGTILDIISKSANTRQTVNKILSRDYSQFIEYEEDIKIIQETYIKRKNEMQIMDYDDLLIKLLELLQINPEIKQKLQQQYKYILVDEYQDTNSIQAEIIYNLANESKNVMVVGDDSQSIYSFRGANFQNIMNFPELFPNSCIITLEENYRSTQNILNITNAVIDSAKEKYSKTLFTTQAEGTTPGYIETDSEKMQSQFVRQKILELREEGIELNEIAVLIRSGWHSNDLEVELKSHNIPFVKFGGFKFIETSHIKDTMAYLKVMQNPTDIVSWQRILLLLEGLGPKAAQNIIDLVVRNKSNLSQINFDKLKTKSYHKQLETIFKRLLLSDLKTKPIASIIEKVLDYYDPFFTRKYDDHKKRKPDLESLTTIAERYTDLDTFLSEMTIEPPDASQIGAAPKDQDNEKITLSTIHSAKGLEWHTVFIISAVDGFIPSFQSLGDQNQIEEERRLLYVAMTRAKKNLFIIKPNMDHSSSINYYRYSGMQFSKISRFLAEGNLLEKHAEKWALVEEKPKVPNSMSWDYRDQFSQKDPSKKRYFF